MPVLICTLKKNLVFIDLTTFLLCRKVLYMKQINVFSYSL